MKRSVYTYATAGIILVLSAALVGVLVFMKNQPPPSRGVTPLTEIAPMEPDSELWGVNFPNQYSSYLKTGTNETRTVYGGSQPFSKLEDDPRLLVLFAGYGFSKEYNEDRGHLNSVTDVREIKRVNEKTPATCYSCKSSNNPGLWAELGPENFFNTSFSDMTASIEHPIGCANCHEANTMRLVVTNPGLDAALEAQGKDWRTFTRQEMRTVVCANCHVEYYFEGGNQLTYPWTKGTKIEDIAAYYQEEGFTDWEHPDSATKMIKMQHPEYELYTSDSTHYLAGVACADCHMPYTRDGATKYSSHDVRSPLLNAPAACGTCHTDVEYVATRVGIIQAQVYERLIAAEDALVDAIATIKLASETQGVNEGKLEEARNLHREAQLRWDFIAAENSMGFHNASEALRILATAADMARQAQLNAVTAAGLQTIQTTSSR